MDRQNALLDQWRTSALQLEEQVARVLIGQPKAIRLVNIAVFARGHVLLQGDVGVGKTTLLRAFARALGGGFARVEGTIDLMPNDLIYYTYVGRDGRPAVDPGPLLQHGEDLSIFFFNEINRARPQVHSLLLRVMAERTVNAFNSEHHFPHLLVFADRNRLEREETFEISSAARDRFIMEIVVDTADDPDLRLDLIFNPRFHDVEALLQTVSPGIVQHRELNTVAAVIQREIQTSAALQQYALDLWRASTAPANFGVHLDGVNMQQLVLAGASPRGMSMLLQAARVAAWLRGRSFVAPEDIQTVYTQTISHRLCFQPVYEMRRSEIADELTRRILEHVAAP
jgi:MoxR-like ATPase